MLNGDVLTDIDLTRADRPARGDRRARARSRSCRSRTRPPTGSCGLTTTSAVAEFVEKPSADQIDTNLISAGAYVLERAVLDLIAPDRNVSIEREVWPAARRRRALRLRRASAYWLDIGTPERYLQGTFDILEGNVRTAVAERLGAGYLARRRARARSTGASCRRRSSTRGCTIAAGAHVGPLSCSATGVTRRARARTSSARSCSTAPRSARDCVLRDCIVAAGVRIGDGLADHRRRGPRRGRDARGAQRPRRAACESSPASTCPTAPSRSEEARGRSCPATEQLELDRETIGRIDPTDQLTDVLAIPEHLRDALWKAESAGLEPWDTPGGLVVAGMGGSAIGGAPGPRDPRRPRLAPAAERRARYGLPPWTTPDTTVLCASATRATPRRRSPATRRRACSAPGASSPRPAASSPSSRAPTACPVIPVAGGFQPRAAVAYMTVAALEVAALCGVGPRHELRDRRRRRPPRAARRRVGPRRARRTGEAKSARPRAARDRAGDRRRRARRRRSPTAGRRRSTRTPSMPAFAARAARVRPQRDRRLGLGAPSSARFSAVFLDDADTHPRVKRAHRRSPRELIAPRRRGRRTASSRAGRRRSSASSRSCCSATSCRSTSPCCAAWTPCPSRSSTA